jgi:hypothetical protein
LVGVGGEPNPSADLLCQLDDDPLGAADVAEPIDVFVVGALLLYAFVMWRIAIHAMTRKLID